MNLLNKLTIKNLRLNKKRTIVTIIGIVLSIALITAVACVYTSAINTLINFEKKQVGDFHVAIYDAKNEDIDYIKNVRGVEDVFYINPMGYAKIDSKNDYKPYAYIVSYTDSAFDKLGIRLLDGRLPQNENEVLIPSHLETNGRVFYKVGDTIELDMGKRMYNNIELTQFDSYQEDEKFVTTGEKKKYTVVGVAERPATKIERNSAPGYTFITKDNNSKSSYILFVNIQKEYMKDYKKVYSNICGIDEHIVELEMADRALTEEELDLINKEITKSKYQMIDFNAYLIQLQVNPLKLSGIGQIGALAAIVIGIIVVTSVFCIKNSFDISLSEKIKQYGMLRSIGATKKQIRKNVFFEGTILGLYGIPLGIILGVSASYILIIISNYFLKDLLSDNMKLIYGINGYAILVAVILGIITIYLSAFRSARKASKVSPIDSIRNSSNIEIKSKKVRSPKLIHKLFGIGGDISYKNLKRNRKKYRTTVISIVVSVAVFIALYSFMNLAFESIKEELHAFNYNFTVTTNNKSDISSIRKVVELDNIENYTVERNNILSVDDFKYNQEYVDYINLNVDTFDDSIQIVAIGEEQYKKYINELNLNYDDVKDKGILFDNSKVYKSIKEQRYMRVTSYAKGEHIKGVLPDNNKKLDIELAEVTNVNPFGLEMKYEPYVVVSDEYYDNNFVTNSVYVYIKSNDTKKLHNDVDQLLNNKVYEVTDLNENYRLTHNLIVVVGIFLYGFIIIISLIGITNIFNTITTVMELRKQEFAMLKSVGMTKYEFNRMIRLESLFMGLKSLVIGIPIGLILSYIIHHFIALDHTNYMLPVPALIISVVVVFILISVIMKYSIYKISKQNTIETIRNENI